MFIDTARRLVLLQKGKRNHSNSLIPNPKYHDFMEFTKDEFTLITNSNGVTEESVPWALENYGTWLSKYQHKHSLSHEDENEEEEIFNTFVCYAGEDYRHLTDEQARIMDKVLKSEVGIIPDNIVVYRRTFLEDFYKRVGKRKIAKGDIVNQPGFLSTGLCKEKLFEKTEYDNRDLLMKIYVPAGTRGIYLNFISHRSLEQEMLLEQDLKLCILDIVKVKHKPVEIVTCVVQEKTLSCINC